MLENNTFITVDSSGMIDDLDCSSDSRAPNVGRWIAPGSVDYTNSTTDPFDVIVGDQQDPGSLVVQQRNGHSLTRSFLGIYTCIIPRANRMLAYFHIGIYQNGFNSESVIVNYCEYSIISLQCRSCINNIS